MAPPSSTPVDRAPAVVLVGVGLLALVVSVLIGGAATPLEVADPGPVVRWGAPVLRLVHDVAATLTVGMLLVGAFVVPETNRTDRRATAARWAAGTATVWAVTAFLGAALEFALIAGVPLNAQGYLSQLFAFVWELQTTRIPVITGLVALAIAGLASVTTRKEGLAALTVVAWLALLPLALAGHSSTSSDHMTGVNALAVHLLGATTWIGGLVALLVLRPALGTHLAVSVRRYSMIAGWAYAALIGSGLLAAWINLGHLDNLSSRYGALLGVKTVAAVLLGVAGWWHRSRVIDTLTKGGDAARAFTRLALGEIVLMAVATGAAVAVARTPSPDEVLTEPDTSRVYQLSGYPDPGPPADHAWATAWLVDWLWVSVAAIAIGLYLRWYLRLRRRGDSWPVLRLISWVVGWLVFVYATSGAPGVYGRVLFSWHMIEHMTVAMIAPLFLVPGAPITLALRALPARKDKTFGPRELLLTLVHSRYLQVLANPIVAASIFFFSLALFYFSPLFELAMRTHTGHVLMMVHFLLSGYVFVWVLIGIDPGPKRWSPLALLVVLFVTISFHAFFGVIITGMTELLAPGFYGQLQLPWLPDPLADQHKGGAIAWGVGEAPTLVLAVAVAYQWMKQDRRETRRLDRRADRDGDAELAAYNAHLAELARRDRERG